MMQALSKLLSFIFFVLEIFTVVGYLILSDIQQNRLTPVVIVFLGLFTIIFGFAGLIEKPSINATQEDLHRAYQAGYEMVERNVLRQERAYQAYLAQQERQHKVTVNALVSLSHSDKQIIKEALIAGIRLVEAEKQLFLRYDTGKMLPVNQLDDMTPEKLRYFALSQQKLELPFNIVEASYREI